MDQHLATYFAKQMLHLETPIVYFQPRGPGEAEHAVGKEVEEVHHDL